MAENNMKKRHFAPEKYQKYEDMDCLPFQWISIYSLFIYSYTIHENTASASTSFIDSICYLNNYASEHKDTSKYIRVIVV